MRLEGKRALITGASQGIGRATALALAREGADVAINYYPDSDGVHRSNAEAVVEEVKSLGSQALVIGADVAQEEPSAAMVAQAIEEFGCLDILVNNAGILRDATLRNLSREHWDEVLDVNLGSMFNCSKPAAIHMRERATGSIVNVASVIGLMGNIGQTNYAAAKAGAIGFTKSLARELAHYGVRVNAVAPGFMDTDMTRTIDPAFKEQIRQQIPLGHFGVPDDIAAAIVFLVSDEARYITGEVLSVNGGWYM
ncbi:MAG: 3-oxoacyl-ACP reductase FabG [Chloroflexota bacterium]|nr:3-oxoacyl-ACP reductase FabG [Chloroflexota bacterium]MDE2841273.1 3-oxoacyl-ACP reductase FabG [Chloroflexota bacterium]MDE2930968.1 3-oxoacyl-ACP reductase FabG [Chloroflexota bacterium]